MQSFLLTGEVPVADLTALASRSIKGFCHHVTKDMVGTLGTIIRGVHGTADLAAISAISIHATVPVITTGIIVHGLAVGDLVFIHGTNSTPVIDGAWIVNTVPSSTTFTILFTTTGTGSAGSIWSESRITTIGGSGTQGANVMFPLGLSLGPFKYVTARSTSSTPGDTSIFYEEASQDTPL